jgi:hypothetical protein
MKPASLNFLAVTTELFHPIESRIIPMAKKKIHEVIEDETQAPQAFADEAFDETGFEEEQVGFPPYWTPQAGRALKIRVVSFDQRDPTFPRWIVQATHNVACQSGPSDEAEPRMVKTGEFFSMSLYAGLPLQRYVGEEVIVKCKEERDLKGGHSFWVWSILCTPEVSKRSLARQEEVRRLLAVQNGSAPPLLLGDDLYAQSQAAKKRVEDAMASAKNMA